MNNKALLVAAAAMAMSTGRTNTFVVRNLRMADIPREQVCPWWHCDRAMYTPSRSQKLKAKIRKVQAAR